MWGFGSGEEGPHSRWEAEGRMLNLTRVSQTEEINACVVGFGGTRQFANFFGQCITTTVAVMRSAKRLDMGVFCWNYRGKKKGTSRCLDGYFFFSI